MLDTVYMRYVGVLGVAITLGCGADGADSAETGGLPTPDGSEGRGGSVTGSAGAGGRADDGEGTRGGGGGRARSGGSAGGGEGAEAGSAQGGGGPSALGGRAGPGAPGAGGSSDAGATGGRRGPGAGGRNAAGGHAASGGQNGGGGSVDGGSLIEAGAAGSSGLPEDSGADPDPCAGGTTYAASSSSNTTVSGYGWVLVYVPPTNGNRIVAFETTMVVPAKPPASGTLFLWPGLQPRTGSTNYDALDNGVLQPVLTWGPTCAPNAPNSYKSWWISGQYVNTYIPSSSPNYNAYHDCHGGPGMDVEVGDSLDMRFALTGTDWTQTVTNRRNSKSVSYTIDMLGQGQNEAEVVIEEYSSKPLTDVIFTSSVVTFASSAPSSCRPAQRGKNDYFSAPRASPDGLRCCISKIILRSEGVDPTSPDSP